MAGARVRVRLAPSRRKTFHSKNTSCNCSTIRVRLGKGKEPSHYMSQQNQVSTVEMKRCEHCGKQDSSVKTDRFGNVLCPRCTEKEVEAEWGE